MWLKRGRFSILQKILRGGFLLTCILMFAVPHAQAQVFPTLSLEALQLRVDPQFPGPGQEVTATLSSNLIDLERSKITWEVDRKIIKTEGGAKQITFRANGVGETTQVGVTVTTSDGQVLDKELILSTATLDLLWEADSYTPAFYRGKGLPTPGSRVTVTAVPDVRNSAGRKLTNDELVFMWRQGSRIIAEASGRGRNSATFPGPELYRDFDLIVEVTSIDMTTGAVNSLTLPARMPQLLLYESHPTLGIRLEKALTEQTELPGGEISVSAQPYFVSAESTTDSALRYTWSLNGETVANPSADRSLIVLRANGAGGSAEVGVTIEHVFNIFQQARKAFGINFVGETGL